MHVPARACAGDLGCQLLWRAGVANVLPIMWCLGIMCRMEVLPSLCQFIYTRGLHNSLLQWYVVKSSVSKTFSVRPSGVLVHEDVSHGEVLVSRCLSWSATMPLQLRILYRVVVCRCASSVFPCHVFFMKVLCPPVCFRVACSHQAFQVAVCTAFPCSNSHTGIESDCIIWADSRCFLVVILTRNRISLV